MYAQHSVVSEIRDAQMHLELSLNLKYAKVQRTLYCKLAAVSEKQ